METTLTTPTTPPGRSFHAQLTSARPIPGPSHQVRGSCDAASRSARPSTRRLTPFDTGPIFKRGLVLNCFVTSIETSSSSSSSPGPTTPTSPAAAAAAARPRSRPGHGHRRPTAGVANISTSPARAAASAPARHRCSAHGPPFVARRKPARTQQLTCPACFLRCRRLRARRRQGNYFLSAWTSLSSPR